MNTTITLGDALLLLIGVCAIILLIYVIRVVRACIPAVKSLTKILDDTQKVTGVVSEATTGVEEIVGSLTESTSDMAEFIKDNQSTVKAMVSFVNAVVAIKKLLS